MSEANQANQIHIPAGKFESIYGYSLDAAQKGQRCRVAFRINCNYETVQEGRLRIISGILDNIAYPEVMRRIADHSIKSDFRLHSVHLIMFRDSSRNMILLNEEVKFLVNVTYKDSKPFNPGEFVMTEDIEKILGLYPDASNDANAGHIMLTRFSEKWYFACDLIYNLDIGKDLVEKASALVPYAAQNIDRKLWVRFLDSVLCACMLATHAIFILQYDKIFSLRQMHKKAIEYLSAYTHNGNLDIKYSDLYAKVYDLRKKIKNQQFNYEEANDLVVLTSGFIDHVKKLLTSYSESRTPSLNYLQLHGVTPEINHGEQKLISFGGIAAETALDSDETVKLLFQVNCKDKFLEIARAEMVLNILDNYAYPEVMRLVEKGQLSTGFKLHNVHLIMYADQERNEILLNDKVRTMANTRFKEGRKYLPGQPVIQGDVEDYLGLFPSDANDKNAAHVILTKLNDVWFCAFDLIYDRKRVGSRYELAKSFLKSAKYSMQEKLYGPFVDALYSATELAIQSILLLHHDPKFSLNQSHPYTQKLFSEHAKLGNIDVKFSNHYIRLEELRDKGRYLNGTHGKEFSLNDPEANMLLTITEELLAYVERVLARVDLSKKPKDGEYCLLGRE